jgi:hypothetical protein
MRETSSQLIKFCGTGTNPAAETKSIGLLAFACGYGEQSRPTLPPAGGPCFLLATWTVSSRHETARPSIGTTYHLENFTVTPNTRPSTGICKKRGTAIRQLAERHLTKPPGRYGQLKKHLHVR